MIMAKFRLNRDQLKAGLGMMFMLFGGRRKINRALREVAEVIDIFEQMEGLQDKLQAAYLKETGSKLTAEEVAAVKIAFDKLSNLASKIF